MLGRVFLCQKDADAFARKMPDGFGHEIVNRYGHYLVVAKDYGDVEGTFKSCKDAGITAYILKA